MAGVGGTPRASEDKRFDMSAIARISAPTPTVGAPKRSAPDLDAQVRTYRAQLADWVTCPSAKTPGGKAKIEQISAKLVAVEGQIEKADGGSPGQLGVHVDTYA
jgi:hypothetical protein